MSANDSADARLQRIKHIVVLMMENRSFDHMLGYLDPQLDVDGLSQAKANFDAEGTEYSPFAFAPDDTAFHAPGDPYDKSLDPDHGPKGVAAQIDGGTMGGFVKDFIAKRNPPAERRGLPMGHFTGEHLPVYDHLAKAFCVCDRWYSSIPGDTWPNRLFSLAGHSAPPKPDSLGILAKLKNTPLWDKVKNLPIFEVDAFPGHLDDDQWRWYSHDPATLRAADRRYRDFKHPRRDNFAWFNRKKISLLTEGAELLLTHGSFLDDAVKGHVRDVSWIDPNFIDLRVLDPNSNDDHPPSDVLAGQALVLEVYDALVKSPGWNDTLLVITYDEHGGFYDHVPPPAVPPGDVSGFATYGVRVPAILVGPRVQDAPCHQLFDHTALIKTILQRFAPNPAAAIQAMGPRVQQSPHLGVALLDDPRADLPDHGDLRGQLDQWRIDARASRRAEAPLEPSSAADGAGHDLILTDLQKEFAAVSLAMRDAGLPAGQP